MLLTFCGLAMQKPAASLPIASCLPRSRSTYAVARLKSVPGAVRLTHTRAGTAVQSQQHWKAPHCLGA
eukprot:366259-Chlamydomonas_euryale.AAC.21